MTADSGRGDRRQRWDDLGRQERRERLMRQERRFARRRARVLGGGRDDAVLLTWRSAERCSALAWLLALLALASAVAGGSVADVVLWVAAVVAVAVLACASSVLRALARLLEHR